MTKPFQDKIELDIRDSVPDWDAFLADKAPEDAPNVLVVLYDDTGLAAWSPFGGRIEMPTLQRLADDGLTYFLGIPPEQRVSASAPGSGLHVVGIEFTKERTGEHGESHGTVELYIDDRSWPSRRSAPRAATSPCAGRGCASATTGATQSAPSTSPASSGPAAAS
jgi:hypothetical protein